MAEDKWRVEVTMTVRRGDYSFEQLGQKKFEVVAPYETLALLEIGHSIDRLYNQLLLIVFDKLTMGTYSEEEDE